MDTTATAHARQPDDAFARSSLELATDERLVALTRAGIDSAFDVIVRRYRPALLRHATRLLERERAEDAVQQALMKALIALREDGHRIQLRPWLYRIVHNESVNAARRRHFRDEPLDDQMDGVRQPPEAFEQSERLQRVVAGISALPARQRSAVVLREFEGRSYDEIAVHMDETPPVVRQLLHRARTRLRDTCGALLPLNELRAWIESLSASTAPVAAKVGVAAVATGVIAGGAIGVTKERSHHPSPRQSAEAVAGPAIEAPARPAVAPSVAAGAAGSSGGPAARHHEGGGGQGKHVGREGSSSPSHAPTKPEDGGTNGSPERSHEGQKGGSREEDQGARDGRNGEERDSGDEPVLLSGESGGDGSHDPASSGESDHGGPQPDEQDPGSGD